MDMIKSACGGQAEKLLAHGRIQLFLDGLDELPTREAFSRVRREVDILCSTYPDCPILATCRIAAKEYIFSELMEVELAPFEKEQQRQFADNWFASRNQPELADDFATELSRAEGLLELSRTPLMLSLLCLVYEQRNDFGENRAQLYKEAVDVLLRRWDAKRDMVRQRPYSELTPHRVLDFLGRIALKYFEVGRYLIHRDELESDISYFFGNEIETDYGLLLNAIEAENGLLVERAHNIYSFVHRTFQEYLAARVLAMSVPSSYDAVLTHCHDPQWLEVILLYGAMQKPTADRFVLGMKEALDKSIACSEKLQNILHWMYSRRDRPHQIITESTRRALDLTFVLTTASARDHAKWTTYDFDLAQSVDRLFGESRLDGGELDGTLDLVLVTDFDGLLRSGGTPTCHIAFQDLLDDGITAENISLHDLRYALESYIQEDGGRQANGVERFRQILLQHRGIGHSWPTLTAEGFDLLYRYYEGHVCLVKCLETVDAISDDTIRGIYETLLLPAGTSFDAMDLESPV
jgi:hypothetical protein